MTPRPAWGSKLFLMLATTTIVIGNRHNYHDNFKPQMIKSYSIHRNSSVQDNFVIKHSYRIPHLRHQHTSHKGPYFENADGQEINKSQNVAHLGDDALLDCRVVMLSGKMVSWLRQSPERTLLTIGESTYTANPRYSVRFKYPNNWRLAISSIQKEDKGSYVCQVNTHPPKMLVTNVTILAPDIRIVDEAGHQLQDRYYKTGSIIELWCLVRPSRLGSRVPYPVWKKNDATLPEHVNIHHTNGTTYEILTKFRIKHAKKADSGEYSCSIGRFSTSRVHIHVLNGEKQAAVHHDQWNAAITNRYGCSVLLAEFIIFLLFRTSPTYFL